MNKIVLVGYSGHSFVVYDIFQSQNQQVIGYCDNETKENNPFNLSYFGSENTEKALNCLLANDFFISVGNNEIREKMYITLTKKIGKPPISAIHNRSVVSKYAQLGNGVMVSMGAIINPFAQIGDGVICNTGCIVEHECLVGSFAHIAPGAVLAGNVIVGEKSFIGANSVVKQGIKIGNNVTIGAGTVVLKDVPDGATVVGNPGRIITKFNSIK